MNDQTNTVSEELSEEEVLDLLKQKADVMGIKYGSRIGVDTLKAKIQARLNDEPEEEDSEPEKAEVVLTKAEREAQIRKEMYEKNMRLVRLRISNLNPAKKELQGEIFTVANKYLGTVKKFIPYGEASEEGYHVPYCLYLQLKSRKFLQVRTRTVNGQIHVDQRWVPEFALEVLPQLTTKELNQLRNAQAAAAGAGE